MISRKESMALIDQSIKKLMDDCDCEHEEEFGEILMGLLIACVMATVAVVGEKEAVDRMDLITSDITEGNIPVPSRRRKGTH